MFPAGVDRWGLNRLPPHGCRFLGLKQGEVEMMQTIEQMRSMTANDLAMLGMQDIAYVKPVVVDGNASYAIHAADGTQMALIGDRDIAFAVVRQNELEPVSVH
jgi:hypothetical protein